jgi:CBS domain-containing protein
LTDLAGSANGNSRVSMYDFSTTAVFTGVFDMTTESIMTSGLFTLKPTNTVADALSLMHAKHVRNIPIVD